MSNVFYRFPLSLLFAPPSSAVNKPKNPKNATKMKGMKDER
jgi:hypothetical protein